MPHIFPFTFLDVLIISILIVFSIIVWKVREDTEVDDWDSCDIEEYNKLQDRIDKLRDELSDPWKDD